MTIANFIPEIWSAQVLYSLRKTLVAERIVNRNFQGDVRLGDTVHIVTPAAITVSAYSGSVTYQTPTSTTQSLLIDQKYYWAYDIDDVDAAQANVDIMAAYMREAAYATADTIDQDIFGLYTDAGHTVSLDITGGYTGVRTALIDAGYNLDNNNVPTEGRWLVVSPLIMSAIRKASDYTPASEMGDEMRREGSVGRLEGFDIFVSPNVTITTGATTQHKCLYGTNAAITFADALETIEAVRREGSFSDGVRGLHVYGRKVVRSGALGVLDVKVA